METNEKRLNRVVWTREGDESHASLEEFRAFVQPAGVVFSAHVTDNRGKILMPQDIFPSMRKAEIAAERFIKQKITKRNRFSPLFGKSDTKSPRKDSQHDI